MRKLSLFVATHKAYPMPPDDVYRPVFVGAAGKESVPGFARDDEGENISARNANWCELTGLYWAWKNGWGGGEPEFVGLVHYRRHFRGADGTATGAELLGRLREAPVILPRRRNYFIETNYSQYVHAHHAQDLDVTREILASRFPGYVSVFDAAMKSTKGHRFNMFVMRRDIADKYCAWLFDVLFELERRLDISAYSAYDARVFGFVAERLLDVWIAANRVAYLELPLRNLESQHWPLKAFRFLLRKFSRLRRQ